MDLKKIKEKYGNVKLKFDSYYKHAFVFIGKGKAGENIGVSVGGDPDSIYRLSIKSNEEKTLNSLNPYYVTVFDDEGETILEWYDW